MTFKELLIQYESQDEEVLKAKKILDELTEKRSNTVKELGLLLYKTNPKSKKFKWKNSEVTIVCRPSRDGNKETWFLRGLSDKNIISFD